MANDNKGSTVSFVARPMAGDELAPRLAFDVSHTLRHACHTCQIRATNLPRTSPQQKKQKEKEKIQGEKAQIRSDYIITDASANRIDITPAIFGLDGQHIAVAARLSPSGARPPPQPVAPKLQEAHVVLKGSIPGGASTPAAPDPVPIANMLAQHRQEEEAAKRAIEARRKESDFIANCIRNSTPPALLQQPPAPQQRPARKDSAPTPAEKRDRPQQPPQEQSMASTRAQAQAVPVQPTATLLELEQAAREQQPQRQQQDLGASTHVQHAALAAEVAADLQALRRKHACERETAYIDEAKVQEEEEAENNSVPHTTGRLPHDKDADDDDDDTPTPQPPAGGQDRASTPAAPDSSNPLRRQGLPCRRIVSRSGDVFVRVGDMTSILTAIKDVLDVRKEQLWTEKHSTDPFGGLITHSGWTVLRREGQLAAFTRLQAQWCDHHGARYLEQHAERARASTPDWGLNDMPNGARERVLRGYFKTHLFENFGGQHWVKFLIAIGEVPPEAVDATNKIIDHRIRLDKDRQGPPTEEALPATTPAWAFRRDVRQQRPCLDAGPPEIFRLKGLRDKAKADMKALEEDVAKHGSQATPEQQADFERRRQNIEERRPGGVFPLIASDPPPPAGNSLGT